MKVIELTCNNSGKHDCGALFTKKEREILEAALKQYVANNKRKTTAKKLYDYMDKHLPM